MPDLDLTSAKALFDRAKLHEENYREITGRGLWEIAEKLDNATGEWKYTLQLNRQRLVACKPILGDCANNLNSVLDNVISAMVRAHRPSRNKSPYYPLDLDHQKFCKKMKAMASEIDQPMVDVIIDNHAKHIHDVPHMFAVKKIANTAKHWELLPAIASALAVAVNKPGGKQTISQIPEETFQSADVFEYHRSRNKLPQTSHSIATSLQISGLGDGIQNGPDTSLRCTIRYVEGLLKAAETSTSGR